MAAASLTASSGSAASRALSSGENFLRIAYLVERSAGTLPPVCVVVHALFAPGAAEELTAAGVGQVVSCNTVAHPTNAIDVAPLILTALLESP